MKSDGSILTEMPRPEFILFNQRIAPLCSPSLSSKRCHDKNPVSIGAGYLKNEPFIGLGLLGLVRNPSLSSKRCRNKNPFRSGAGNSKKEPFSDLGQRPTGFGA
ncbi:MAG: hypothetical protein LBT59_29880 [Clostridiales bacterium]|nr:hypothetical protein [Clostridiales bacterium]